MFKKIKVEDAIGTIEFKNVPNRSISQYGKKVNVSAEEFQRALNPNKQVQEAAKESPKAKKYNILKGLDEDQKAVLESCFDQFSTVKTVNKPARSRLNANGVRQVYQAGPQVTRTMSEQELGRLFSSAGVPIHPHTLNSLFTQIAKNYSKNFTFEDLLNIIGLQDGQLDEDYEIRKIFESYDKKKRGYFQYEEYRLVAEGVAKFLTEGDIKSAFNGIDLNGDGKVTYANFVKVMRGQH